jgi:hypothetical protein
MSTETLPPLVRRHRKPWHLVGPPAILPQRVEGELSKHTHKEGSSDLPGERIFAICLWRVRFDWFKSKDGNPARLEKDNCWVVTSVRGTYGPHAVEVDLEDSSERVPH